MRYNTAHNIYSTLERNTYFEVIKSLNHNEVNDFLSDTEVEKIVRLYYDGKQVISETLRKHISVTLARYRRFKNENTDFNAFNSISTIEKVELMKKHKCLRVLLFHILLGRISVDNSMDLSGMYEVEEILTLQEIEDIKSACSYYHYKQRTVVGVFRYIIRIMIIRGNSLRDIDANDIYEFYRSKQDAANATFNVLKYLGHISINEHYNVNNRNSLGSVFKISIQTEYEPYLTLYKGYCEYIETQEETKSNTYNKIRPVTLFLNWLSKNNIFLQINELNFELVKDFIEWMKEEPSGVNSKVYSIKTMNHMLSAFGGFLKYLVDCDLVNIEFAKNYLQKYNFSYTVEPTELFNDIVPSEDRKTIEKIIKEVTPNSSYPYVSDMLKLMHYCALRPIELTTLKLACLTGTDNSPNLHVHKSKNGDERHIPLIKEAYDIVKKYMSINKNSKPVYSEYDEINEKRLFSYRDRIMDRSTLNNIFRRLQVKYKLVDNFGDAKYTQYILRKLRITMWIESGISLENIMILAGHRDVESQNSYYVGKEFILENGLKSYIAYYKEFIDKLGSSQGKDNDIDIFLNSSNKIEDKDYLEELQNTLLEIENKGIFDVATKMAYKDYPEIFFPLTNGLCGAIYEEGEDFKCEVMELPCLECNELIDAKNYIQQFDEFLQSIYLSRKEHEKSGLDGLVNKDDGLLERLQLFYQRTFQLSLQEVQERFEKIKGKTVTKRGRKKKNE